MIHAIILLLLHLTTTNAAFCPQPAGCCCCTGSCFFSGCPPCPCPAPSPSHPQPICSHQKVVNALVAQYNNTMQQYASTPKVAPAKTTATEQQHQYTWKTDNGWTSGFYAGILWQLANLTSSSSSSSSSSLSEMSESSDDDFRSQAAKCTLGREPWKEYTNTHDVGFVIFNSFGAGVIVGGSQNSTYRRVITTAAHSLATRFNPIVGMIRSWGDKEDNNSFQVIIDNLMNLEILFWEARQSGNKTLYNMAHSHAIKTGQYFIREDGSTPHRCVFNPKTG